MMTEVLLGLRVIRTGSSWPDVRDLDFLFARRCGASFGSLLRSRRRGIKNRIPQSPKPMLLRRCFGSLQDLADVVDPDESGLGAGFLEQSFGGFDAGNAQKLECDGSAELTIFGEKDRSHAALSQRDGLNRSVPLFERIGNCAGWCDEQSSALCVPRSLRWTVGARAGSSVGAVASSAIEVGVSPEGGLDIMTW